MGCRVCLHVQQLVSSYHSGPLDLLPARAAGALTASVLALLQVPKADADTLQKKRKLIRPE